MIHYFQATFCFLMLSACAPASAQQLNTNKPFKNTYKWDASLDMYNLIRSGNTSFLLRYAPDPQKFAYRLELGWANVHHHNLHRIDDSTGISVSHHLFERNNANFQVGAGVEFRKTKERVQLFYGPSVSYRRQSGKLSYSSDFPDIGSIPSSRYQGLRLNALAGVRYFVAKQVAVSMESNVNFYYLFNRVYTGPAKQDGDVVTNSLSTKSSEFGFEFNPLTQLNISIFF